MGEIKIGLLAAVLQGYAAPLLISEFENIREIRAETHDHSRLTGLEKDMFLGRGTENGAFLG